MALIAIFCDGTWNSAASGAPTHVLRLAAACAQTRTQKVLYFEGVGTGTGMINALGRWLSRVGGGLFGWGLNARILEAYGALCRVYQPGDKIMIFGFSRGAYTARSLVGLIRKCGILADPSTKNLRKAFRLYRRRGARNAPDSPKIWKARRALSPDFATSQEDVVQRADHSYLVRITYLGVWDTVAALGLPKQLLGWIATLWNARYAFHDTSLSRLVEQARHAVSLDERRVLYEPELWNNLVPSESDPGLNKGDQSPERPYQQVWFAGHHSIVGGSSEPRAMAAASLDFIWKGAAQLGLEPLPDRKIPDVAISTNQQVSSLYKVGWLYRLLPWLVQWRRGPRTTEDLHESARHRAALLKGYRPATIRHVLPRLFDKPV